MSAQFILRQLDDRRRNSAAAIARHFLICERRVAARRKDDSAAVCDWLARFDRAKRKHLDKKAPGQNRTDCPR